MSGAGVNDLLRAEYDARVGALWRARRRELVRDVLRRSVPQIAGLALVAVVTGVFAPFTAGFFTGLATAGIAVVVLWLEAKEHAGYQIWRADQDEIARVERERDLAAIELRMIRERDEAPAAKRDGFLAMLTQAFAAGAEIVTLETARCPRAIEWTEELEALAREALTLASADEFIPFVRQFRDQAVDGHVGAHKLVMRAEKDSKDWRAHLQPDAIRVEFEPCAWATWRRKRGYWR